MSRFARPHPSHRGDTGESIALYAVNRQGYQVDSVIDLYDLPILPAWHTLLAAE